MEAQAAAAPHDEDEREAALESHDGRSGSPGPNIEELFRLTLANGVALICCRGSVLDFEGDAIVNAANSGCVGGGGVDGAINDAGGHALVQARRALRGCATGSAKSTRSFGLRSVRFIIHAVGPAFGCGAEEHDESDALLASAYRAALREAVRLGARTVGFSLLSAGIFRGDRPLVAVLETGVRACIEACAPGPAQLPGIDGGAGEEEDGGAGARAAATAAVGVKRKRGDDSSGGGEQAANDAAASGGGGLSRAASAGSTASGGSSGGGGEDGDGCGAVALASDARASPPRAPPMEVYIVAFTRAEERALLAVFEAACLTREDADAPDAPAAAAIEHDLASGGGGSAAALGMPAEGAGDPAADDAGPGAGSRSEPRPL